MKVVIKIFGFFLLGLISFVFFLYMTFPYEVLKEAIANEISQSSGLSVRFGDMGPKFPIGLTAEDIEVKSSTGPQIKLDKASVSLSVLSLFMLKLNADVDLHQGKSKELNFSIKYALFDLIDTISGTFKLPSEIALRANGFPTGDFVNFALEFLADSPSVNPLFAPVLGQFAFEGNLKADVYFDIDPADISQSTGRAIIDFKNAQLLVIDEALTIPSQKFAKALVKAQLANGRFTIDKASGFNSEGLQAALDGRITLKPRMNRSLLDLSISVKLFKALLEQFGFILDAMTGGAKNGAITVKIGGTFTRPNVNTL